jgi:hypothetical protein
MKLFIVLNKDLQRYLIDKQKYFINIIKYFIFVWLTVVRKLNIFEF